jgi:hypothetical protein
MHPALYSPNPYYGSYSEFDVDYPQEYTGAFPNPWGAAYDIGQNFGQSLGQGVRKLGNSFGGPPKPPPDPTDWSGVAKIALVVGGAAAIYFIYRASKAAAPVAERLGGIAGKLAMARAGGAGGSKGFANIRDAEVVSSRKFLTA